MGNRGVGVGVIRYWLSVIRYSGPGQAFPGCNPCLPHLSSFVIKQATWGPYDTHISTEIERQLIYHKNLTGFTG